ncbi:urotensin-2B [Bufo bufo]|uniref:urotensin-2B n=1 Tax=Bufo bufo TaxID=8384 RepID=UPI001ABE8260|nr:urotensin-2B [Bufo bufo]
MLHKAASVHLCLGTLTFLVMISMQTTEGKPYPLPENELYPEKDVNHQEMLLTLLLNKHLPETLVRRPSHIGMELESKLEQLEQLEKLKEQLSEEKSDDMSYVMDTLQPSHPNKRACFWKYCV